MSSIPPIYSEISPSSLLVRNQQRCRRKALLLVASCDPDDVSESLWGYHFAEGISQHVDATVIAMRNYGMRNRIADVLPLARVYETEDWPVPCVHPRLNSMLKPGYLKFYAFAWRTIRNLLKAETFDLVHQFTPFGLRYPSPATGWSMPVILGPYGGSVPTPPGFRRQMRAMAWYTKLRSLDQWRLRHDPVLRRSLAGADVVLGVGSYVQDMLATTIKLRRFETMVENGVSELPPLSDRIPGASRNFRLLYVGRITRTKGVLDLVRAMAHLRDLDSVSLDVVGDGDDRVICEAEAQRLGLSERISFHGRRPRHEISTFYNNSDLFVFPSLREASGQVILDSMAHGRPLIVADTGGPGCIVNESCGIHVQPVEPAQYAKAIADAIHDLYKDRRRLFAMGLASREVIKAEHLWPQKIQRMLDLYESVLSERACGVCRSVTVYDE